MLGVDERVEEKGSHVEILLPLTFEYSHSCQTSRTHSDIRKFIRAPMRCNGKQVFARFVHASQDQRRTNVSLMPKQQWRRYYRDMKQ